MAVRDWSTTAGSNTGILSGLTLDGSVMTVPQVDDAFRDLAAQIATGVPLYAAGYLYGLTLSNNGSDATNDIDIAVGSARDSTDAYTMALASGLTKRLDAAWAVGTNAGGLDTGAIANTTYHVFLIRRSDTGVVDALFSTSATAPTMPANYDQKRRIGSIIRVSGAIVAFQQVGDVFRREEVLIATSLVTSASTLFDTKVPTGIVVAPILYWLVVGDAGSVYVAQLGSAALGSADSTVIYGGSSVSTFGWRALGTPPLFFLQTPVHNFTLLGQFHQGLFLRVTVTVPVGWTRVVG